MVTVSAMTLVMIEDTDATILGSHNFVGDLGFSSLGAVQALHV